MTNIMSKKGDKIMPELKLFKQGMRYSPGDKPERGQLCSFLPGHYLLRDDNSTFVVDEKWQSLWWPYLKTGSLCRIISCRYNLLEVLFRGQSDTDLVSITSCVSVEQTAEGKKLIKLNDWSKVNEN